jgi:hypothetical protein
LGHVDISIEMRHPGGSPHTRRRRFLSLSRHADTPRQLLLELNAEATDYIEVPDTNEDRFQANWEVLRSVLLQAPQKLTRLDILDEWPEDFDEPNATTLSHWLNRAVERSLIAREGSGLKSDPFRFWLPEREAVWRQEIWYDAFEEQRKQFNFPFESLRDKRRKSAQEPMSIEDDEDE